MILILILFTCVKCEIFECAGILSNNTGEVCSGNGNCTADEVCECYDNDEWAGQYCEIPICFGIEGDEEETVCEGNGECSQPDTCQCFEDFFGIECDIFNCRGKFSNETGTCSGHGECYETDKCTCEEHYYGLDCEVMDCRGYMSNETLSCSDHGTCLAIYDVCNCTVEGYSGVDCEDFSCFGVPSTDTNSVCSGHGECVGPNDCTCDTNYDVYDNCSYWECQGISRFSPGVCNYRNGSCVGFDNCTCFGEFYGNGCDSWECYGEDRGLIDACNGHGICVLPDRCECSLPNLWDGLNCSIFKCDGIEYTNESYVCNMGKGRCTTNNTCDCTVDYWAGEFCQFAVCDGYLNGSGLECNGVGTCLENNVCQCYNENDYTGQFCQYPICHNIPSWNKSGVCSGRGNCTEPGECECVPSGDWGWGGGLCQYQKCDGKLEENEDVCSDRGTCSIAFNSEGNHYCICDAEYHGLYGGPICDDLICNGVLKTSSGVCNGRGNCYMGGEGFGLCNCTINATSYGGFNCSDPVCDGIPEGDTEACGNFVCEGPGKCSCDWPKSWDKWCENFRCFGEDYDSSETCDGRGMCTGPSLCNCTTTFAFGEECSETILDEGAMDEDREGLVIQYELQDIADLVYHGFGTEFFCNQKNRDGKMFMDPEVVGDNADCEFKVSRNPYELHVTLGGNNVVNVGSVLEINPITGGNLVAKVTIKYLHTDDSGSVWEWIVPVMLAVFVLTFFALYVCCLLLIFLILALLILACPTTAAGTAAGVTVLGRGVTAQKFNNELVETLLDKDDDFPIGLAGSINDDSLGRGSTLLRRRSLSGNEVNKRWKPAPLEVNHRLFRISPENELLIDFMIGNDVLGTSVYKARWRVMDQTSPKLVTVKLIKDRGLFEQAVFFLFEREIQTLETYLHPNLLKFFGASIHLLLFQVSLVFDFYENGDLKEFMISHKKKSSLSSSKTSSSSRTPGHHHFTEKKKIEILSGIVKGLEYLHFEKKKRHGDLRTQNIYLDKFVIPKLSTEFGINRILKKIYEESRGVEIQDEGNYFKPPEETNEENLDFRSDIFSFGFIMYEITTEKLENPFENIPSMEGEKSGGNKRASTSASHMRFEDEEDLMMGIEQKIANDPAFRPPISKEEYKINKKVFEIIKKCWNHDLENRYTSRELVEIFQQMLDSLV